MAYSPEPGLIVDEQYENEDQQLLSEVLFINKPSGSDITSVDYKESGEMNASCSQRSNKELTQTGRIVSKSYTVKTEHADNGKQADSKHSEQMLRDGKLLCALIILRNRLLTLICVFVLLTNNFTSNFHLFL